MALKNQLDALLQEKMDRKDFLKYSGTVILGLIGVTGLLRMILGGRSITTEGQNGRDQGGGYGNSAYGR